MRDWVDEERTVTNDGTNRKCLARRDTVSTATRYSLIYSLKNLSNRSIKKQPPEWKAVVICLSYIALTGK